MARAPRWRRHSPCRPGPRRSRVVHRKRRFLGQRDRRRECGAVGRCTGRCNTSRRVYPPGFTRRLRGNDTHTGAVGQGTLTVVKATPVITITAGTVQYDGLPHAAAVTALGGGGMALSPVVVSYNGSTEAPANPGVYAVQAFYAGDSNHQERSSSATLTITESIAPTVAIASPHDGATYALGQVVTPKFTCADNVGIASCIPSASAAVPTSSAGIYSYVVTARDLAGNISVKTVLYSVRASAEHNGSPQHRCRRRSISATRLRWLMAWCLWPAAPIPLMPRRDAPSSTTPPPMRGRHCPTCGLLDGLGRRRTRQWTSPDDRRHYLRRRAHGVAGKSRSCQSPVVARQADDHAAQPSHAHAPRRR